MSLRETSDSHSFFKDLKKADAQPLSHSDALLNLNSYLNFYYIGGPEQIILFSEPQFSYLYSGNVYFVNSLRSKNKYLQNKHLKWKRECSRYALN